MATLMEDRHAWLLHEWILQPTLDYVHPQCIWKVADGHPCEGLYHGLNFYTWYIDQLAGAYSAWTEVVERVIGSQIGGIVVGDYQFQREKNGLRYTVPFIHFYRITCGKITSVQFFMGEAKIRPDQPQQIADIISTRYLQTNYELS
jgi:hypothetical protein